MACDEADCEGVADFVRRECGMSADDLWTAGQMARAWQGDDAVQLVDNLRAEELVVRTGARRTILVRASLLPLRRNFVILHGMTHIARELLGVVDDEYTEQECDYTAAALTLPRRVFARVATHDYHALAQQFRTTETLVALRVGEVTNEPVAVVAPHNVRARGEGWRDERTVREFARTPPPGIVKVRLEDEPRRVALHA